VFISEQCILLLFMLFSATEKRWILVSG